MNSHSLGVVATDARTMRKRNAVVIPRNTPLPVTAKRIFRTQKTGQTSILVQIVEGESASPDDCSQIGKCVVRDLPRDLAAQTPIDVPLRYEDNGRLTVHVNVAGTDRELRHEIDARKHADARTARRLAELHHGGAGSQNRGGAGQHLSRRPFLVTDGHS